MKVPQKTFLEMKIFPHEEAKAEKGGFSDWAAFRSLPRVVSIADSCDLALYPFISIKNNPLDISSPGYADLKHGISSAGINTKQPVLFAAADTYAKILVANSVQKEARQTATIE